MKKKKLIVKEEDCTVHYIIFRRLEMAGLSEAYRIASELVAEIKKYGYKI